MIEFRISKADKSRIKNVFFNSPKETHLMFEMGIS